MDYLINGAVIICNPFGRKKNDIPIFNQTEVNEKGIIFCFSLKAQIANIFGPVSLIVTTICHCNAKATCILYKRMGVASLTHKYPSFTHTHKNPQSDEKAISNTWEGNAKFAGDYQIVSLVC